MMLADVISGRHGGVYWVADGVSAAVRGASIPPRHVLVHGARDKAELLKGLASALHLPEWFGHNWDALEECLLDLPIGPEGLVLELSGLAPLARRDPDSARTLVDILQEAVAHRAAQDRRLLVLATGDRWLLPPMAAIEPG